MWLPRLSSCLLLLALAGLGFGKKTAKRPPRVEPSAKDFGGGSATTKGHGRPMQEQDGASSIPELTEMPTWAEFYKNYVRTNRPVVIRNHASMQRAFKLWTDEYLSKHWGSRKINVEVNKTEERGGPAVQMTISQFLQKIYHEEAAAEFYAIIDFDEDKKAKADFDLLDPINCKEVVPQSLTLWMSSGGTKSVLHCDDAENFLMLLAGKKRVMLVHQDQAHNMYADIAIAKSTSPVHQDAVDLVNFPRFANVTWFSGELGPGDTLYIPHTFWHQVNSEGRNLAANVWWGHKEVDWQWWRPWDEREYNPQRFGIKGATPFDTMKARSPAQVPCTPLSERKSFSSVRFMDETHWKGYIRKRSQQPRPRPKKGEL
mmetsp:Transcript_89155/g.171590  ORF Transcript_89155/g.171590 Transcript_89155/m.171590 type:complete len:372 (-) Transcript_89155:18-1133(-)